jgi:hypothetical protein
MGTESHEPPDIVTLIQSLDRIAAQDAANRIAVGEDLRPEIVAARRELERTRALLTGQAPPAQALNDVRRLIASGLISWSIPKSMIDRADPSLLLQSMASAALWPLIITRKLPVGWKLALRAITSESIVLLVSRLRAARRRTLRSALAQRLAAAVIQPPYADGISHLREDLRSGQDGRATLVALYLLRDGTPPKVPTSNAFVFMKWLLIAAAGGTVGNRFDALVVSVYNELQRLAASISSTPPADAALQHAAATPTLALSPPSPTPTDANRTQRWKY